MPWEHCQLEIMDDQTCPSCGMNKAEWTLHVDRTRVLQLSKKRKKKKYLTFRLWQIGGKDPAQTKDSYEVLLEDGSIVSGQLNNYGLGKHEVQGTGCARVRLLERHPREVEGGLLGPRGEAMKRVSYEKEEKIVLVTLPTGAHWSQRRGRVRTPITLIFTTPKLADGADVTFEIYPKDQQPGSKSKATLNGVAQGGVARVTWTYEHEEPEGDTRTPEEKRASYAWPDFYFVATADDGTSARSGIRRFSAWFDVQLTDDDGNPRDGNGIRYRLTCPDGEERTGYMPDDGHLRIDDVAPGTCELELLLPDPPPPVSTAPAKKDREQSKAEPADPNQETVEELEELCFDQMFWTGAGSRAAKVVYADGVSDEAIGVAFRKDAIVQLWMHPVGDTSKLKTGMQLDLEFWRHDAASNKTKKALKVAEWDGRKVKVDVPFSLLEELLEELGAELNCSFLRAGTRKAPPGSQLLESRNLLYPALQRALYFLPGVLGSHLSVINDDQEPDECFPEVCVPGMPLDLDMLVCKKNGKPHRPVVRTPDRLKILESVGPAVIYKVKEKVERACERFPKVYLDRGKKKVLQHIVYRDVPYDWRLNIADSHKDIAKEIKGYFDDLRYAQEGGEPAHPFLAEKLCLAGHSTGGVIMRGLATTNNHLSGLVEHAFHINVPHWGAPKAEFVLLAGDMGVDLVTQVECFRQISPDMPIVYFLTSGAAYGPEFTPNARFKRFQAAIKKGAYDTKKRALYGHPGYANEGPLAFNSKLAHAANQYVNETGQAGASATCKSYVFHSGGHPTIARVGVHKKTVVPDMMLIGDGTVPTHSQIADLASWNESTLFKPTPGAPMHVPAPNTQWIWERVLDVLNGKDVSEHTMDWPTGHPKATAELLAKMAIAAQRKDSKSKVVRPRGSLALGEKREHKQADMYCGLALVRCEAGEIEVKYETSHSGPARTFQMRAGDYQFLEFVRAPDTDFGDDHQSVTVIGKAAGPSDYSVELVSALRPPTIAEALLEKIKMVTDEL